MPMILPAGGFSTSVILDSHESTLLAAVASKESSHESTSAASKGTSRESMSL